MSLIASALLLLLACGAASPAFAETRARPGVAAPLPPGSARFAESLERSGQFREAAVEYRRFAIQLEDSSSTQFARALARSADCYRLADLPALSLRLLDRITSPPAGESLRVEVSLIRALALRDQGDHRAALDAIGSGIATALTPEQRTISAGEWLHLRRWSEARDLASGPPGAGGDSTGPSRLGALAVEGARIRTPHAAVAVAWSAVLPGAGRIYSGRRAEGIYSFMLHAFAAWQAYRGFDRDGTHSTRGWVATGAGAVLYGGNLYGSALTARQAARERWESFDHRVDAAVELALTPR